MVVTKQFRVSHKVFRVFTPRPSLSNLMLLTKAARDSRPAGSARPPLRSPRGDPCAPFGATPVPGRDWAPGPLRPGTGPRREGLM